MQKHKTDDQQASGDPIADMKRALAELEQVLDETHNTHIHTAVQSPR